MFARNYFGANKWVLGTVTAIRGPLSYEVTLADGRVFRRHIDQLRQRTSETSLALEQVDDWLPNPQSDQSSVSSEQNTNNTTTLRHVQHRYVTNLFGLTQLHITEEEKKYSDFELDKYMYIHH